MSASVIMSSVRRFNRLWISLQSQRSLVFSLGSCVNICNLFLLCLLLSFKYSLGVNMYSVRYYRVLQPWWSIRLGSVGNVSFGVFFCSLKSKVSIRWRIFSCRFYSGERLVRSFCCILHLSIFGQSNSTTLVVLYDNKWSSVLDAPALVTTSA